MKRRQETQQACNRVMQRWTAVRLTWSNVRAILDDGGRRRVDSDLKMDVSSRSFRIGGLMSAEIAEVVGDVEGDVSVGGAKPLIG